MRPLLARFCAAMRPGLWAPPTAAFRQLRAWVDRLQALKDMRQQELNRLQALQAADQPAVEAHVQTHLSEGRIPAGSDTDYHVPPIHCRQDMRMFETTIAGSLPKPSWLAEPGKLWLQWKLAGDAPGKAKRDATLVWLKAQEDAGIDVVSDGEQSRQYFAHGFLESVEGLDFQNKVKMGIRDNRYEAMVAVVVRVVRLRNRVHATEAQSRGHTLAGSASSHARTHVHGRHRG